MSAVVERFKAMSSEEITVFFTVSDAVTITELIRAAEDDELRQLLAIVAFREQGVQAILRRFSEFADPDRLQQITGVVRFDLQRAKSANECHTVRFSQGSVTLESDAHPDVTIRARLLDFVRLVTGQSNAALLYLGDELSIEGEAMLALEVGTIFTLPGSGQVALDPTALDPVDVATAVAKTSPSHLRSVMSGGFRPIVLEEVFRRLPDFLDPRKASKLSLAVGFRIGGRPDGDVDRYCVRVAEGVCTVETDPPEGQRRDATITIEGADFLKLATGQLNPVRGVLTGTLKVRGDRGKALALNGAMSPPAPRS